MQPIPQETADLVRFTKGILNGTLHFFVQCSVMVFAYDTPHEFPNKLNI